MLGELCVEGVLNAVTAGNADDNADLFVGFSLWREH